MTNELDEKLDSMTDQELARARWDARYALAMTSKDPALLKEIIREIEDDIQRLKEVEREGE
jgi:hypothetical protein